MHIAPRTLVPGHRNSGVRHPPLATRPHARVASGRPTWVVAPGRGKRGGHALLERYSREERQRRARAGAPLSALRRNHAP